MAALVKGLYNFGKYVLSVDIDPRVEHYPLMKSPFVFLSIIAFYVYFVLRLGPELMANRQPFALKKVMLVFNSFQILACAYFVYAGFPYWSVASHWLCYPVDWTDRQSSSLVYHYFLLKMLDLLDTVFFVLRKKSRQVSFLHMYHHVGMTLLSYSGAKYMAGGHDTSVGYINCIVHMFMYSYYLASALWPETKYNVSFKKFITQLQMMQFFINVVHSLMVIVHPSCDYPKFTVFVIVPQNLFMFLLFADFYKKSYASSGPKAK